ncbi:MAG TPA: hypothetical protein VMR62_06170 [Bryobacteraceae bacterium]|jgi:hypothetical protein|nr:hypothetical protein [Bryobacteraceae bacterium]
MRKFAIGFTFLSALAMTAMATEFTGYISDAGCAAKQGAKTATDGHAGCAKSCLKKGDKAVLVTPEGKIYTIANQDKVIDHAGEKVTLVAEASGDDLTVSEVK